MEQACRILGTEASWHFSRSRRLKLQPAPGNNQGPKGRRNYVAEAEGQSYPRFSNRPDVFGSQGSRWLSIFFPNRRERVAIRQAASEEGGNKASRSGELIIRLRRERRVPAGSRNVLACICDRFGLDSGRPRIPQLLCPVCRIRALIAAKMPAGEPIATLLERE